MWTVIPARLEVPARENLCGRIVTTSGGCDDTLVTPERASGAGV